MGIKTIPLSHLERDLRGTLSACADSGEAVVVQLPDDRMVLVQGIGLARQDSLTDELLEANAEFRAVVAKSKVSPRRPFPLG